MSTIPDRQARGSGARGPAGAGVAPGSGNAAALVAVGRRPFLRSPRRVAYAALGLLCVGLGVIGIAVPGLPTTVFLIAASYLFTRSCPVLEEKILRAPMFRPYARYLDGTTPMPARARASAMMLMWAAVLLSLSGLQIVNRLSPWCAFGIVASAIAGTVVVARIRR